MLVIVAVVAWLWAVEGHPCDRPLIRDGVECRQYVEEQAWKDRIRGY